MIFLPFNLALTKCEKNEAQFEFEDGKIVCKHFFSLSSILVVWIFKTTTSSRQQINEQKKWTHDIIRNEQLRQSTELFRDTFCE